MDIDANELTKRYRHGVVALDHVSLHHGAGMLGLLGPNGAGKTTLMRMVVGIVRPSSGRITVGGHDLASQPGRVAVKRALGYLPQELGLYPDLNAAEFLDYVSLLKGLDGRSARKRRVAELLELTGLDSDARRPLKTFSGGMKQRVGIAQALLNDPRLLVVDEPTAGLDPEERLRFRNLLVELARDRSVVLSTHIVEDVAHTAREVAVLANGRIRFRGAVADLIARARGAVWITTGEQPAAPAQTVAVFTRDGQPAYRVVAEPGILRDAEAAEPTLEDAYVRLMQAPEAP